MIDEGMGSCILHQMYQNWIIPELEARVGANTLPPDFQIKRCLIRLPKNAPPIVQFNEETTLTARVKVPIDRDVKIGDDAWLEDIEYIERVQPPELNGVRVAFFYAHWVNGRYSVFCDLRPNSNDLPEDAANWSFGESIAKALQASVVELALAVHDSVKTELMKVGLWAAPALLPYPLSKIARLVKDGNETEARQVFVEHCSAKRLTDLVSGWCNIPVFNDRKVLFEQALCAHVTGQYCLSISTLTPHLEGVMTDWLHSATTVIKWRQGSKIKQFQDLIASSPDATPTYRQVVESTVSFILEGPALADFKSWYASFDTSFANRHVVGHGRFEPQMYSQENSAKLFLMLDTLYQLISAYAAK